MYSCIVSSRTFYITWSVGIYQCMLVVIVSLSVDVLPVPLHSTFNDKLLSLMRGPSHPPCDNRGGSAKLTVFSNVLVFSMSAIYAIMWCQPCVSFYASAIIT